jgi:molecular chaperone HtpG
MAEETVQVGKYTLESLTTGMYSDPKIVYREYIQNSVDSLENAVSVGLIEPQSMRIDIIVNAEESYISIKDNGTGISAADAAKTLMNVGSSKKRNSNNRGFRGIGRLGGMSYCDTLTFTTSAESEKVKTVVTFDCKRLRYLLVPGEFEDMSLSAVLEEITTIDTLPEKEEKHYLCVEMKNVNGFSDLLDIDAAKSYISQVAPLPYHSRHFIYTSQLKEYLMSNGYSVEEFPIFVGEDESDLEPVYKPNKSRFRSDRAKRTADEITSMSYFDITIDGELYALGWYGNCGWYGFLSEKELSGFRVRKGNILIGDSKTMNVIFKEARFNGWAQGEIFIVTDKLIPNARRDDFEQNDAYYKLIQALSDGVGLEIARTIREASLTRNNPNAKAFREVEKKLAEASTAVSEGFNSTVDKEKLITTLTDTAASLSGLKIGDDLSLKKKELQEKIETAIEEVTESKNFKINQINSGIDKKSKQVLKVVSDILSRKLAKVLVDEIIEDIVSELNRK